MCYLIHVMYRLTLWAKALVAYSPITVVSCTELGVSKKTCKGVVSLWMLRLGIQVEVMITLLLIAIIITLF